METERIALSQRERDRLKVLHEVQQKQLTQVRSGCGRGTLELVLRDRLEGCTGKRVIAFYMYAMRNI
jgi:hypothetical protein